MSYWGPELGQSDYAFETVSVYVGLIKERMMSDLRGTIDDAYKEEALLVSLRILRVIAQEFPKATSVAFTSADFRRAKEGFAEWRALCEKQVPKKHREEFLRNAEEELQRCEAAFGRG